MRRPPKNRVLATVALSVCAGLLGACGGGGSEESEAPSDSPPTSAEEQVPSGSFSSLSYNVAGLPQGINPDQFPEQHIPLMSPLLDEYDVVVVQEDFAYPDLLRAEASHEFQTEPHPGPAELNPIGRETAAVGDGLNVFSTLRLGELDRVPWRTCGDASGDCLSLKGFAATTLQLDEEVSIDLYTLHLDAGGADTAVRADNLEQLAAHLQEQADDAVLLGGDWNLNYDEDPDGEQLRSFMAATGLQDVCDVVDCGADDDVIDRFLFRSGDRVSLTPTSHRFERDVFVNGAGGPLSDHDPLAVQWDWSANE